MQTPTARRPGEVFFVLLLTAFSGWALLQSWLIAGFSKLSSPGVFPMLASAVMVVASLFILVNTLRKRPALRAFAAVSGNTGEGVITVRLFVLVILILLYVVTMPLAGFILSSWLFLFTSFVYLWRKSILTSLLLSTMALTLVYSVFRLVFQVVLPGGSLTGLPF